MGSRGGTEMAFVLWRCDNSGSSLGSSTQPAAKKAKALSQKWISEHSQMEGELPDDITWLDGAMFNGRWHTSLGIVLV